MSMVRDNIRTAVLTLLLVLGLAQVARTHPAQHPLQGTHEEVVSFDDEQWFIFKTFGFNINWNQYDDHLTINENVNSTLFPEGITGSVKLVPGEPNQEYSFLVMVQATSSNRDSLLLLSVANDTHTVYVTSADSTEPASAPIDIDIIIFVKSRAHMNLNTMSSKISFSTQTGDINVNLIPKRWSSGPWTTGDLTAFSTHGDIAIWMPFEEDALSLRNGTAVIETLFGSISGTFVHGHITTLKAFNSLSAILLPYSAFPGWGGIVHNFITTETRHGNVTVEVLPPVIDTYYKTNPLFFAVSRHWQGMGEPDARIQMKITYPGQWGGTAVGYSRSGGNLVVSGEDFEEIEKNVSTVKVQRRPIGSELWFETDMGIAELHLNPCFSPSCGF